ncbi:hypothetical protein QAD02_006144 [Eretmocerus hayati]|uniref:Uncharacterized protein n=1 Tax=Eretmocerus hayati TaxID=131215 RepID=A0ACC2N2F5_9HYME|nr:hypothetical protein QAD02_006144 [Eretmocerus hayati]
MLKIATSYILLNILFYLSAVENLPNSTLNPIEDSILSPDILRSTDRLRKYVNSDEEISIFIDKAETKIKEFIKCTVHLNCLAIPIKKFADTIERWLTRTEEARDVHFQLHTRSQSRQLNGSNFNLKEVDYDIRRGTVVIVHGFWSRGDYEWVQDMKNALLRWRDLNVLVVDWERGSFTWNYLSASIATRIVGAEIAELLHRIELKVLTSEQTDPKEWGPLHLIGHSLGSHICAHAAYLVDEMNRSYITKWTVNRITALDPAQPCFINADSALRLDKNDAQFVDVIHTNGKMLMQLGLGLPDPTGHMDFYPNGGQVQVGCYEPINLPVIVSPLPFLPVLNVFYKMMKASVCSHGRSYELFTDSINTAISKECSYIGHKWDKDYSNVGKILEESCSENFCPQMGINSIMYNSENSDGVYYVATGGKVPYCKNVLKRASSTKKSWWESVKEVTSDLFG